MLGYLTAEEAKKVGFTNHGSYYGIPIYMTVEECPMIATKVWWLEWLMTVCHYIEGSIYSLFLVDEEPAFCFTVKNEIK